MTSRFPRGCGHLNSPPSRVRTSELAPVMLSEVVRRGGLLLLMLLPLLLLLLLPPPPLLLLLLTPRKLLASPVMPPIPSIPVRRMPPATVLLVAASLGRTRTWLVRDRVAAAAALLGDGRARSTDRAGDAMPGDGSELERIQRSMRVAIVGFEAWCRETVDLRRARRKLGRKLGRTLGRTLGRKEDNTEQREGRKTERVFSF